MRFIKENLNLRLYQQTILNSASRESILCVIPTGLGKTYIAIALASLRLKTYPNSKILFLAPTRPLVDQHKKTFSNFFDATEKEMILITGEVPPSIRKKQFREAQIIFSTPQCIKNDLDANRISLKDVSLLVVDEAHRAVGDYAYVDVSRYYKKQANNFRILALTASPGSNEVKISEICQNLFIAVLEVRGRDHVEVKDYVQPLISEYKFVELPSDMFKIKKILEIPINERLSYLKKRKLIRIDNIVKLRKRDLIGLQLMLQKRLIRKDFSIAKAASDCAFLLKTLHALRLLESESLSAFDKYMDRLWSDAKESKTKAVQNMVNDVNIELARNLSKKYLDSGGEHPKLDLLKKIVEEQIKLNKYSKILIFTEFRDNIPKLVELLREIKLCSVEEFVGQASKSTKGMSQKKQVEVLERFKEGYITCLVATAVAEEGIDVPDVDLVVFYTPVPSAIRSIQRRGRTARKKEGKLVILITKNTRDEATFWIAKRREKGMDLATKKLSRQKVGGQKSLDYYENSS